MTSDEFGDIEQLDENLRKWFKEKWVRFGPDGKIRGACARGDDSEGKPKCLPQKKAQNLGKKGRKYAASKKRREDPNPERRGKAKNVATKKKTNEGWLEGAGAGFLLGLGMGHPTAGTVLGAGLGAFISAVAKIRGLEKVKKDPKYQIYINGKQYDDSNRPAWDAANLIADLAAKEHDIKTQFTIVDSESKNVVFRKVWEPEKADWKDTWHDDGIVPNSGVTADNTQSIPKASPKPTVNQNPSTNINSELYKRLAARKAGKNINEDIPFNECPKCRGPIVQESMMNEKQDACYHKVKSRYKVWPSAYASGALVQCRKKGASNWGTGGKKNESSIMKGIVDESENVLVLYIDGKPSAKYAIGHEAKTAMERLQAKFPNRKFELKREMREAQVGEAKAKPYVKPYNSPETGEQIGWVSSDGYHKKYWQKFAKDSAIKHAKLNPDEVQEDYTGEFAAEKTPAINPYGGLKDNQFRGAISETPTDNPTGASGEGGWRKYKPKSAGRLDETTYEYDADELLKMLGDYQLSKPKGDPSRGVATRIMNALRYYKGGKVTRAELLRSPGMGKQGMVLIDTLLGRTNPSTDPYAYFQSQIIEYAEHLKNAIAKKDIRNAEDLLSKLKSALNALKRSKPVDEDTAYAGGMGQGGNAGQSYRKFKPKSAGTFKEEQLDEKCWDTHKQVGMKKKGGKSVPNCVPKESAIMKGLKR